MNKNSGYLLFPAWSLLFIKVLWIHLAALVSIELCPEYVHSNTAVNVSYPCVPCSAFSEGKEQTMWFDSLVLCCKDHLSPVEEFVTHAQAEIFLLTGNSWSCLFSSRSVGRLPNIAVRAEVVWHAIFSIFDWLLQVLSFKAAPKNSEAACPVLGIPPACISPVLHSSRTSHWGPSLQTPCPPVSHDASSLGNHLLHITN